jgi:hypothetical protein
MKLADLDPRWLERDGHKVGLIFLSPSGPQGSVHWRQTCFFQPTPLREQNALVCAAMADQADDDGDFHDWQPCNQASAWTAHGELDFAGLTITPSLDGSAGGPLAWLHHERRDRMRRFLALAFAGLLLTACATGQGLSPRQSIYATEGALTGAELLAASYAGLPHCGVRGVIVCSDRTVVAKIVAAKDAARGTVKAAVQIARDPDASQDKLVLALHSAEAAVRVLQALIPPPQTQVSQ